MNINSTQKLDYSFFQNLYEEGKTGWKGLYFEEAQRCFESAFSKINRWGWFEKEERYGILSEDGKWDALNRFNTHPNLYRFVYEECINSNPNCFTDFGNPIYHEKNIKVMWEFLMENFDLYFTKNITPKYYNKIYYLLNKSWQTGNITTIIAVSHLKNAFPNISEMRYGFEAGDKSDMMGVDIEIKLDNDEVKKFQVKSGRYTDKSYGGVYYVNGSANDLSYKNCDYYIYGQPKWQDTLSQVIIFKNSPDLKKKDKKTLLVPQKNIIYKTQQFMSIPENLSKLMEICGKNDIEFRILKEEEESSVSFNEEEQTLTVKFIGPDDSTLLSKIQNTIKTLEERFK